MMKRFALVVPLILFSLGGCGGLVLEPVIGVGLIEQERVIQRPDPYYSDLLRQQMMHEQWRREHERWDRRHHEWHERNNRTERHNRQGNKNDRDNGHAWEHEHHKWHSRNPEP